MQLLDSLLKKEMSFREVKKKSMGIKSMQVAKDILLQKVECETWEKAAEVLPHYCNEQALSQFKVVHCQTILKSVRFTTCLGFVALMLSLHRCFVTR